MAAPTTAVPRTAYRAEGARALDRAAAAALGITTGALMERAGAAAWAVLRHIWPDARRVRVVAGAGNNGGDGYVLARLARAGGAQVLVSALADPGALHGDARVQFEAARAAGVPVAPGAPTGYADADVVVDALLGTGVNRDLGPDWCAVIGTMNGAGVPILALDIPSGLDADSGRIWRAAVRASATVTFIGVKRGLLTGAAADHCGTLWYADLDVPASIFADVPADAERGTVDAIRGVLGPRRRTAHKGEFGHVLIVGGESGYAGAPRMAAEAAARVGAGLTSLATRAAHAAVIANARPELMVHVIETGSALRALIARASVVVIGPGLGQSEWSQALFATAVDCARPLVVDADALNLLARDPCRRADWILTPHPGEAARLLGSGTAAVNADRYGAARGLQTRYGGVCVLKGAGTIVDAGVRPWVCAYGNPGMATAGMGDVLAGVIGGLLAQGLTPERAALAGVTVHALAAEAAAAEGERGMLATDLYPYLRREVNRI